ncbi:hypothetical protein ARMSODRAFT_892022, partial [Armillaria solidipes]
PYTLRPFSEPEIENATGLLQRRMKDFNFKLSGVRISVEHAFGAWKGRFPSLRCMGAHRDVQDIYRVVEALIVLHNMCLYYDDHPENIVNIVLRDTDLRTDHDDGDAEEGFGGETIDGEPNVPAHETATWLKEEGYRMRLNLLDEVCPVHIYQ